MKRLGIQNIALSLAVAGMFMLAACTGTIISQTVTVTEEKSGQTVTLRPGDTLVVRLPVQAGTGFSWRRVGNAETVLTSIGSAHSTPTKRQVGVTVLRDFSFKADREGSQDLSFEYRRPWLEDQPPARTFGIRVTVKDS